MTNAQTRGLVLLTLIITAIVGVMIKPSEPPATTSSPTSSPIPVGEKSKPITPFFNCWRTAMEEVRKNPDAKVKAAQLGVTHYSFLDAVATDMCKHLKGPED